MGGIYKRGSVYWIRYEGPQNPNGTRNQRRESCKGLNKRQAEDLLRQRETEVRSGIYVDTTALDLSAYFDKWLERKAKSLSPTTIEDYQQKFAKHINPSLGSRPLQKIKPLAIQHLLDSLTTQLSTKTVRNISGILHSCLADALTLGMIHFNPAQNLALPACQRPNITLPDSGDLQRMIAVLEDTPYRIPFILIAGTGMRRGEVLGLKWQDLNWDTRTLVIQRAMVQTKGVVTEKLPKSGRVRVVLLPVQLMEELRLHKADQEAMGWRTQWISTNESGGQLTPSAICKGIEKAKRNAGVKAGLHSWRHAQATMLLLAGVPAKIVSERLGHATINITQDIYAHVMPQMQSPAVDIIEADWERQMAKAIKKADSQK